MFKYDLNRRTVNISGLKVVANLKSSGNWSNPHHVFMAEMVKAELQRQWGLTRSD